MRRSVLDSPALLDMRAARRRAWRSRVLASALASDSHGKAVLMLPIGMVLGLLGYGTFTWGYINIKGYNISLREWFSPLHPYTGPLAAAGTVPPGSVFPTGGTASPAPAAGAAGKAAVSGQ